MELFKSAVTIRLRSYKDKYLTAGEDEQSVFQDHDASTKNAVWTVEFVQGRDVLRLKSCYGKYLTATNIPFIPKVTGKKVLQIRSNALDPRIEWQPIRDGFLVKLKTVWGNYLRPNSGLPPWKDCVTHDIPHWHKSKEKILWDVEIVERRVDHRRVQSDMTVNRSNSTSGSFAMSMVKPKTMRTYDFI